MFADVTKLSRQIEREGIEHLGALKCRRRTRKDRRAPFSTFSRIRIKKPYPFSRILARSIPGRYSDELRVLPRGAGDGLGFRT